MLALQWALASALATAQPAAAPSAQIVVERVRANVEQYFAALPSLFCDERFLSERLKDGHVTDTHTTLSTFRVRGRQGEQVAGSRETRVVRQVDGVTAHGDAVQGPYRFFGGYDAALGIFLDSSARCLDFRTAEPGRAGELRLDFAARTPLPAGCSRSEEGHTGTAVVDAREMQVLRVEQHFAHAPGMGERWRELRWTVDFAPVELGGRRFWTPSRVVSDLTARGTSEVMRSEAGYTGYHKLEVTSTVLPPTP